MEKNERVVYIVDGARTPFLKMQSQPNKLKASDLAVIAGQTLLCRQPFLPTDIEEVVMGCVSPEPDEVNIARLIALRLGCGNQVPGYTVQRNCGSGMQAIDSAFLDIISGRYDLILAGGTECMSRSPMLFHEDMANWLGSFNRAKGFKKVLEIFKLRPHLFIPQFGLMKALTDPIVNLSMGQTAEKLAFLFNISREEMDEYAFESQNRAKLGFQNGYFNQEIVPLFIENQCIDKDTGIRETSVEKLSTLKPAFDKPFGLVTAGNSSQISDGAAFVILASEKALAQYSLQPIGRIINTAWSALAPDVMGLGPVHAIAKLLQLENLTLNDIDYWEINEAFAAQVLACLKALDDEEYCKKYCHLENKLGKIDRSKLNVDGGAIAIGHPVGASGARLVCHLLQVLERNNAKKGIASLCIGGGQGGAMLIERL